MRPVGDDEVGAGALDRRQRLERSLPLVEESLRRGRLDHRVLAGDVVRGERKVEALARRTDHVEVGKRRLDHQHVGALGDVQLALAQRLADVRGIHLVAAAVAERRRRLGGLAERPVERRGVLGRVRDDRRVGQLLADRADAAVHHVARRDDVGAGLDVAPAVRTSSSSVASLSISSPSPMTPQWPCEVYSQRQTSVTRTSSRPSAARAAPAARCRRRPRRRSPRRPSRRGCRRGSPP